MNSMNSNQQTTLLAYLLLIILVLSALCILGGLTLGIVKLAQPDISVTEPSESEDSGDDTEVSVIPQDVLMKETADAGMSYIDEMIFFGESTTSHLRARGVLTGGTETKQVWTDASGTRMLSSRITSETFLYPPTGEMLTVSQACEKELPRYLVLSFGLNGITNFIDNQEQYLNNYGKLIAAVQKVSPDTKIILQTIYPVCKSGNYSVDTDTLNEYITTLNALLPTLAARYENVRVADTASVLLDPSTDRLNTVYDNGDGIHLTADAYKKILAYLRTHAWL